VTIYYRVYGLTFRSECELPGLDRIRDTSVVDYSLRFDDSANRFEMLRRELRRPWYISARRVKRGKTVVEVWRTENCCKFLFHFYDGVEFIIDRMREEIWVGGLRGTSPQSVTYHLVYSLPGFLLGLRKSACLHGAVIGWGESAIALLGSSKCGKSVLCAHMAAQGIEVVSEDLVALDVLDGTFKVYPGYPWIGLRPESLHLLPSDSFDLCRLQSVWHYLDEAYVTWDLRPRVDDSLPLEPKKLVAIYLLTPVEDSNCEPTIEQVPRYQALMALMEAANRTHIPYQEFKPQEFAFLGSVIASVPTYGLRYHLSVDSLKALSGLLVQPPELLGWRKEVGA
jgi:hypothetical protein